MSNKLAWLQCVALLSATAALAQPAPSRDGLDPAWNGGVPLGVPVAGYNVDASIGGNVGTVVQPDGHILLAGPCTYSSSSTTSNATICMARVLPDGQREYGFGPGQIGAFGFAQFPSWPDYSLQFGLARQGDGRIVVAGASIVGDTPYALIARLDADGTLDASLPTQPVNFEFAHNANFPANAAVAVAQQADGKFLVAGRTIRVGNNPNFDFAVARLRADFSLDPTFNGSGVSVAAFDVGGDGYDFAQALAIQDDGKIVVAGYADTTSSGTDAAVLRLNANGTLDTSFGNAGRATFDFGGHHRDDVVNDVKIDRAGRIWLAGSYQQDGINTDFLVARLRADGSLDTAFNMVGYQTVAFDLDAGSIQQLTDKARSLLLQPDGKIVLAGSASNGESSNTTDFAVARLRSDGSLDPSFGPDGSGKLHGRFASTMTVNAANALALGGSGIVLAGFAANYDTSSGATSNGQFGLAMIRVDAIFADGFER